jgi:dTDP-4-amino-4,6-dideoxygalactose transaminase
VKKHYFLGLAAGIEHPFLHLFTHGSAKDASDLTKYLSKRYNGEAMLCKNGRSALTLALKAYFNPGDTIIVNAFTCYAVYEAIKAAELKPIFADISRKDLNFTTETLERVVSSDAAGIIIQNSLGNPVDIQTIEHFAGRHGLVIIEDLAHCAGLEYSDGREAGTVGAAAVLSFGKEKSIDAVSGGAVVFRHPKRHLVEAPRKLPKLSDYLRERWYPVFGLWCRKLTRVGLSGGLMRILLALHFVEKSADNRLDLSRRPTRFEAKIALSQFKKLKRSNTRRLRDFYLVDDRETVLKELREAGYFFDGFWYERPVSPKRYYKKVHFNEKACPVSVVVSKQIVNLPNYYSESELAIARMIIEKYLTKEEHD